MASWAQSHFSDVGCPPGYACCQLQLKDGTLCGAMLSTRHGQACMKTHIDYKHPHVYNQ